MIQRSLWLVLVLVAANGFCAAQSKLLIPMDNSQDDHLKAYGIIYWTLSKGQQADWLLNYRGGSFMVDYADFIAAECRIRGVSFQPISGSQAAAIYSEVQSESNNMDVVRLEQAPKIAVYVPPTFQPWDDAVTLVMQYAEIPYDKIWDKEVLNDQLKKYDWVHLHHEDFTGQYGKFYASFANAPWYLQQVAMLEQTATELGFSKVSTLKLAVADELKKYVGNGGFLFAMCSATDSYDIALAARNTDICDVMFDGDPPAANAQNALDFSQTLAFQNFTLEMNPYIYEYSDIDVQPNFNSTAETDFFTLFDFSAKHDPVPSMLTQCHVGVVGGFMGQTTAFHKQFIKKNVILLAEKEGTDEVKYLTGNYGRGTFTFYGGHDPEDYQHAVSDPPTDLSLHKNSPGYRLILNNILFPSAKKKKQKT
ncbi:MAG: asparagine synthetase B [Chlorobi bacterium]|nr:asparagine synthetase B [Chlorobiota bacterium]